MRKTLVFSFVLFFCFTSLLFANSEKPVSSTSLIRLTVALDQSINPDHAPLFIAQKQGFFKAHGLHVVFITPNKTQNAIDAVIHEKAKIGISYQPAVVIAASNNEPIVRIGTLIGTPLDCIAVKDNSAIERVGDLKNKKIGISSNAFDKTVLLVMLKKYGLSLKDVKLVKLKGNLADALISGRVDAITGVMRNSELTQLRLLEYKPRAFYPEENNMPIYDELVFITKTGFEKDPEVHAFLAGMEEATQYLMNHPEESWQLFAKAYPLLNNELNHHIWFDTLSRFELSPAALDKQRYNQLALFLKDEGLIRHIPPLNTYTV